MICNGKNTVYVIKQSHIVKLSPNLENNGHGLIVVKLNQKSPAEGTDIA